MAPADSHKLTWLEILGLREPRDSRWGLVRTAQLRELSIGSLLPMVTVYLGCGFIAWQFWDTVPMSLMTAWLALILMTTCSVAVSRKRNIARRGSAKRSDMARAISHSAIFGLIWSIPPLFFAPYGGPDTMLMIAAFSLALMGGATLLLYAVPTAAMSMVALIGLSLSVMLIRVEMPILASLAFSYGICLCYALLNSGRAMLTRLRNDLILDEQREVVNLLLHHDGDVASDWLWQIDSRKCIVDPSPQFAAATGHRVESLEGLPLLELLAGPEWQEAAIGEELRSFLGKLRRAETFSKHLLPIKLNGRKRWWKISGSPRLSPDKHVIGYRGVIADETDRQANERRTHQMAHFDGLTGLPNRAHTNRLLHERIARCAETGDICAFLMIDLDRFKAINDTLGHPVGDKLLERVAKRLSGLLQPGDKCGRLGGDEFAMIVAHTNYGDDLDTRARQIIETLSQPYYVDDQVLHIGASLGSAMCPKDGRSAPMLLRNADLALYKAKDAGRGVHHSFEPSLLKKAEERREIEAALRFALANGEFSLVYQPVITLETREVAGFEALLRWTSQELGEIPPDQFIPIAEETRLIDPIGEWVFRTACAEAAKWPENYRLAINLSAGQLKNPHLCSAVISTLSRSGLDPRRLEVETTEAILNRDNEQALKTFEQLGTLGVTVALDDFGTGRSTLSFIGQTRFSSIKIDQSFIRNAETGSTASIAVIRAVIAMANSLGISTIAEGVENDRQFKLAERLGCDQVQGYFLDRPMTGEAVQMLIGEKGEQAVA